MSVALLPPEPPSLHALADTGSALLTDIAERIGVAPVAVDGLRLLHDGDAHFARLLSEIDAAQRSVAVEMYQLRPDAIGRRVIDALEQAAARGVDVRLLADAYGSAGLGAWLRRLRRRGVDARWYQPLRPWRSPVRRTHRKVAIFDGRVATLGGRNVTGEFSERLSGPDAWRDVSAWMEGDAALQLAAQFEAAWAANGGAFRYPPALRGRGGAAEGIVVGGADGRTGHAEAYAAMVEAAREEILIANPYFMPPKPFRERLLAAARRGVKVSVVVPRRNDVAPFKHAGRRHYDELLRAGVEIWERRDRMVHAKVAVVDRAVAAVGSTNVNRRSFHANAEALLITSEPDAVRELVHFVAVESPGEGERLTPGTWAGHPDRKHLLELMATTVAVLF